MLPGKNGFEVLKQIRALGLKMPILMLTARDMPEDKVTGLNEGADDYLVKPFELNELLARIRALTRRSANLTPNKLTVGQLVLDTVSHEVYRDNNSIKLTSKEYRILEYLMRNPGLVCSRTMINEHVWGFNYVKSNIIDVYMSRLRSKIDGTSPEPMIVTVHGTGYKLKKPRL
jgi:DNA-binding response OmpR family regulator